MGTFVGDMVLQCQKEQMLVGKALTTLEVHNIQDMTASSQQPWEGIVLVKSHPRWKKPAQYKDMKFG